MAHYYITDNSVPIMVEDGHQICTVDGQSYHLILQDVNNGVNGGSSLIAYAPTTADTTEIYTHQLAQHTATYDHRPNVYIINTDDLTPHRNPLIEQPLQVQVKTTTNVVRVPKTVVNTERQEVQWVTMPENTVKASNSVVRNQSQRTAAALALLEQGSSDRLNQKHPRMKPRLPAPESQANVSNESAQRIQPVKKMPTFRLKSVAANSLAPKPSARPPIRPAIGPRHPAPVQYRAPALPALSERIKQTRIQAQQQTRPPAPPLPPPPRVATPAPKQRVVMSHRMVTPKLQTYPSTESETDVEVSPSVPSSPEKMDVDSSSEKGEHDSSSESFAYLQKVIDNPANAIVQQQIKGNRVKMLVVLPTGEQRLITFDLPNEDCTVQNLLEEAQIPFDSEPVVSLVVDPTLNINYIVESVAGMISTMRDSSESTENEESSKEQNAENASTSDEEPKFIEGKLAVCPNCGISSMDFNRCTRCKKKLTPDVKQVSANTSAQKKEIPSENFYKKKGELANKFEHEGTAKRGRGIGPRARVLKAKPMKEPECLTLSSDDEDDSSNGTPKKHMPKLKTMPTPMDVDPLSCEKILEKEPMILLNSPTCPIPRLRPDMDEHRMTVDGLGVKLSTSLLCRTVRIGSYKYIPNEEVVINHSGLRLQVPLLEDNTCFVSIDVRFSDIVKVLIHFGKSMPVVFFYTTISCGERIRELLGMQDTKGQYYDPASKDQIHKRITLLPEIIDDESKLILKYLFPDDYLGDLTNKEANDILMRASPKDNSMQVPSAIKKLLPTATPTTTNGRDKVVEKMTVYPPPPQKGGITINTEDYACLAEDQFLNDVIIDFYLKYLTLEVLSEVDQQRTHVFSSYFYKRLTSRHTQASESASAQTAAAKRHARVQKWTKNVNIFEKDFVIIPINEHAHWFLAIICFPGLVGTVLPPPSPVKDPATSKKNKQKKDAKMQSMTIGSTTITQVATTITIDQADDDSERDEAEGDDDEMDMDSDDEESETEMANKTAESVDQQDIVKSPCILIFDSLAGASRSRVVATLRDYLTCEHVAKMGVEKTFSKDTIKGACPKIPQQSNFTDCGLYVLQYVESFFQQPILDYTLPIKSVKNWFEEIVVTRKREELSSLLIKLMKATNPDRVIKLPAVQFPTHEGKLKPKPEVPEKGEKTAKAESEAKKKATGDEERSNVADSAAEASPRASTTVYTIVGCSSMVGSGEGSLVVDVAKPSSTGSTLAYLKNKRIPRLMMRESDNQDGPIATKKHKSDSADSSCK